jgi:hypothetical protein
MKIADLRYPPRPDVPCAWEAMLLFVASWNRSLEWP